MEEVAGIFSDVQRMPFKVCSQKLSLLLQNHQSETNEIIGKILDCVDHALVYPRKDNAVDKLLSFFADYAASAAPAIFQASMQHLLSRTGAADKIVRTRACDAIASIMTKISTETTVSEHLFTLLCNTLSVRLKDKVPAVRAAAIKAVGPLSRSENDPLLAAIVTAMESDSSKDVRIAAVFSVVLTRSTLPAVVARLRDIDARVRVAVLKKLSASVDIRNLESALRAVVIHHGLTDRDPDVKAAAISLVFKWLALLDYNIPRLIRLVDLLENFDECELLAHTLAKEVERRTDVPSALKKSFLRDHPEWSKSVHQIKPADVLWVHVRCVYAAQHMTAVSSESVAVDLVPETVQLCELLRGLDLETLGDDAKQQQLMRNLLGLTSFLDGADVSGAVELKSTCLELMGDLRLPRSLLKNVLMAWKRAALNVGEEGVTSSYCLTPLVAVFNKMCNEYDLINTASDATAMVSPDGEWSIVADASLRASDLLEWALEESIGGMAASEEDVSALQQVRTAFLEKQTLQPLSELRLSAIRCLGKLTLFDASFIDLKAVLLRSVCFEMEDCHTRCTSLQALVDMALVYESQFKNDLELTNTLIRLLEHSPAVLQRVCAESAAKLLFSGVLADCRLFAMLLKLFFFPQLTHDANDMEEVDGSDAVGKLSAQLDAVLVGSRARLQQILSVFFHAYLMAGNGREVTVFDSISDLIADVALLVKDETVEASSIYKISNHLLSMCENLSAKEGASPSSSPAATRPRWVVQSAFHMRISAAVCRELLKLGSSKRETTFAREFVRTLCAQQAEAWLQPDTALVLLRTLESTNYAEFDKATQGGIDQLVSLCKDVRRTSPTATTDEISEATSAFLGLAPGLADLFVLAADGSAAASFRRPTRAATTAKTTAARKTRAKPTLVCKQQQSDEDDDDDNDEDVASVEDDEDDEDFEIKGTGKENKAVRLNNRSNIIEGPFVAPGLQLMLFNNLQVGKGGKIKKKSKTSAGAEEDEADERRVDINPTTTILKSMKKNLVA